MKRILSLLDLASMLRTGSAVLLAAFALSLPRASFAAEDPGAGFSDPEGIPERPVTPDIEPVYRGPRVDMLATIRKRGVLRVGVASTPPMVMHGPEGELLGFSIDVSRKLAEDLGVEVEFVPTSWSQIIPDLLKGNSDVIISGLWGTPTRALVVNFSEPTTEEGVYLFTIPELLGRGSEKAYDTEDVRIAVFAGTVQEQLAKRHFPNATHVVFQEGDEMQLVAEGKANAIVLPTFSAQVVEHFAAGTLKLALEEPIQTTVAAMAIRKGDPDFLNYLNSWINFYRDSDWIEEESEKWSDPTRWFR